MGDPCQPIGFPELILEPLRLIGLAIERRRSPRSLQISRTFYILAWFCIYIYIHCICYIIYIHTIWYIIYIYIYVSLCEHHTHIAMVCVGIALLIFMLHPAKAGDTFRQKKNSPGLGFHLHLERILLFTPHRVNG